MKKYTILTLIAVTALVLMTGCSLPMPPGSPAAAPQWPAAPAQTTPVAPVVPADNNAPEGTEACKDGSTLDNVYADISRIPLGNREGASVYELSWDGSGFAGFDRIVLVLPRMDETHMGFVNNARTVHGLRYCGVLQDVVDYAPNHVKALRQSSQDGSGNRPAAEEIPVVLMNLDGSIVITKAAPTGPSLDTIKAHLEMTPQ